MPLRSSHGLFSRHTYFCFKYIHDCLWTRESKLVFIRPSEINRAWKCKKLLFVRARSSCDLDSGSEPKEVSSYLSCLVEFEDRPKREVLISSNSSSSEKGNRSLSVSFDLGLLSKGVYIKKFISSYGTLLSHSFFPNKFAEAAMLGWNVSMAKTKGTQEWRQFWTDGRRTHTGHAHGHDDHDPHEKLGAYGEKVLRWGLWSDVILTIAKVAAGYISGSTAIIADAAHSASDIVLSGVALWSAKASKAPPDQEHPYGHGKIETMGALSISTLLLVTGGGIAWTAIDILQAMRHAHLPLKFCPLKLIFGLFLC